MSRFDKRIKVNTIIENQLPEFILADFPKAVDFFQQYYISQEFQGGPSDLINNFDQYLKVDNLVPEVVVGLTSISSAITSTDTTITVPSTKGFPDEYGLLKIDDEIITYTGITSTSFTGCIRGFSGVSGYNVGVSSSLLEVNRENLVFEETTSTSHESGSTVKNLSVLFIQEFFKKLKKTFLPGFENNEFASNLDVGNFVKLSRSFYQSKGIEESIKILFKVLYGVDSKIIDLEQNLIKPSSAEYIRREVLVADVIGTGEPQNLVGQTIFKSDDLNVTGSVSEVEVFSRDGKAYYKISLFVGFDDIPGLGEFSIAGFTRALYGAPAGSSILSVDSTVGFGTTGKLKSGLNTIEYTSKSINQFFGCTGISVGISTADDIRADETVFGYENGDLSKKVELRITGVVDDLIVGDNVKLVNEGDNIFVKNLGQKIGSGKNSYKEIFANSWKYNTSSRFKVSGSGPFKTNAELYDSAIKVGDQFDILRRNTQIKDGSFNVNSLDIVNKQINVDNLSFNVLPNQEYDIRRVIEKASSTGIEIEDGNEKLISDVLNVYSDGDIDGYVASNSLPSYDITANIIEESIVGPGTSSLDGYNQFNNRYSYIRFTFGTNRDIKFIEGDAVVYKPEGEVLAGLSSGGLYYVDPQPTALGQNVTTIALYNSRSQIGTASTIQVGIATISTDKHNFVLQKHADRKLSLNKILRKIPLSQNLFIDSTHDSPVNEIGILKDGVQIYSPISDDNIFFGPLSDVEVFNGGQDYDIINPPKLSVDVGIGNTALVEPILSGSVKKVFVDPQDFDIEEILNISLTGGNGTGCVLEPILGLRFRDINFDSRNLFFGGGLDLDEETVTFTKKHNLASGQVVYYRNNGNTSLGISTSPAYPNSTSLADGDPYYVRVVNPTTVRIFNSQADALFGISGINTVGLTSDTTASGIHKFRTEPKNTLLSVKVIEEGTGYEHRKLRVNPSGVSTSFNTINYVNHGFNNGDLVEYSPTVGLGTTVPKSIQGLSTSTSYFVIKVDNDTFKLADAGIGGTVTSNFDRRNTVGLGSTGTGYQTFKYPEIKVNVNVSYGSTVVEPIVITPVVTGSFIGAYLYEEGDGYGSNILNHQITPDIDILSGSDAEFKPVIVNGEIENVIVVNQGKNYNSIPDLEILNTGGGEGAILRPVLEDGIVKEVVVINSGIGYSSFSTEVRPSTTGKNGNFSARVRQLTLNNVARFGEYYLESTGSNLSLSALQYSQNIAKELENSFSEKPNGEFNQIESHSPIIGWAFDGNPIYGPIGYSDPDDINSSLKIISSSYIKDITKVADRPTGFNSGFFIDDYFYNESGDLDSHNGRFCKTPEFPNGTYAYFATTKLSSSTNKLEGVYPYFVGKSYRSPFIKENAILNHDFDFNNSNLIRNTTPFKISDEYADNDFLIESNETIRQVTTVESVEKGVVEDIEILDGGANYKVGDVVSFNSENTNGSGFAAVVSKLVGIGVSKIETELTRFNNSVFTWKNNDEVQVNYVPFMELNDQSSVIISGLNTSILNLTNTFQVGVKTDRVGLGKTMSTGSSSGVVEDIFVDKIPNTVSIGGTLRIGSGNATSVEEVKVLNVYKTPKIIRVFRNVGAAHTFGSNVDILNNRFTIPVKTEKFESFNNDIVFFNAPQSIGVGTTGVASTVNYTIGETTSVVSIPERAIYLPNHPFKTGQELILTVPNVNNSEIDASTTNSSTGSLQLPSSGLTTTVYAIKKDENYIGIVASNVGIGSTSEGLYFLGSGVSGIGSHLYSLSSNFEQAIGDVDKVVTTVTTKVAAANTTTHGLVEGDVVSLNVIPNLSVGIGTTTPIKVNYNSEFQKLLINSVSFVASNINTANQIQVVHGLKTGDKVLYQDGGNSATGLSNGEYYVYKVSDNLLELGLTYKDVTSNPPQIITLGGNSGGSNQSLSLINPSITVTKNAKLTFGLSTTTLAGFDFKLFYDKDLTNEYLSSKDSTNFNVIGIGTIGIGTDAVDPIGAQLSVQYSNSSPEILYYGVSKGGYISTTDKEVVNHNEIRFVDSMYSGDYKTFGISSETFNISPKSPELLNYDETDCETLEYSTSSNNVNGEIKDIRILSSGFNYKRLPEFNTVVSVAGTGANIKALSKKIGKVKNVRILDFGYEYSADKTLSPEAFIPPVVSIDNLDVIDGLEIESGGQNYSNAPSLIVFNPITNTVVDDSSLEAIVPNQTISKVNLLAPINGLDSTIHKVIAINNSNGVGINSVQSSVSGVVTCFLNTPFGGFVNEPFEKGDRVFVEGITRFGEAGIGATQGGISTNTTVTGDGFNSEDYNYQFFEVEDYVAGTISILTFNLSGVTTNPGIAKTFQSGYAVLVNEKVYPKILPSQKRGVFELNEKLNVNNARTDLKIVEIRDDYVKIDGLHPVVKGDRISGEVTNVSAEIIQVEENKGRFTVGFSNRQNVGWTNDTGKLSEDYQRTSNNDYYQNLSYTVKSSIEWDKFVNSVNRLVHPSGLKNFADTSIQSIADTRTGIGETESVVSSIILDVISDNLRVDAINNFDFVTDFNPQGIKSKNLKLSNKILTDFSRCLTNRVLIHDDISDKFSSVGFSNNSTIIEELNADFGNYLIQIIDPDTSDSQLTELVVLTDEDDAILFEKTKDFTTLDLGKIETEITSGGSKNLVFNPTEKSLKDHDIKILKTDFNTDLLGNATNLIGNVKLTGVNVGASTATSGVTTTTIVEFPNTDFNALFANIFVEDSITKNVNYNEVTVDFDGITPTISQVYIDKNKVASGSVVGILTAVYENNKIKLQIINDTQNALEVRANVVGLGTTTAGIGTYRFASPGQPAGSERSARLESGYVTGTSSTITYATLNKLVDNSAKSIVRVSCGETSAVHQIISLKDADDILTIQYPFVSAGSTTGIGTFGGEIDGNDIELKFYPDPAFTSLIEVQSFNTILYTINDFDNNAPILTYGTVSQELFLSSYDGLEGKRANKVKFNLTHEGTPIYAKSFDPNSGIVSATTGIFTIPNHFFNTDEKLTYKPESTFVGVAATAIQTSPGVNLPSTVFAIRIDENQFKLSATKSGTPLTFVSLGSGNTHKLGMEKPLTKTIIGLDGVVQQPITFTSISHTLDANIGAGTSQFVLSGIGSIQPSDVLRINEEFMKIEQVGFASITNGIINDADDVAAGVATLPVVKVERGVLGISASSHSANDVVRIHRGSFNIVDSAVHFIEPPKGNTRSRRTDTNLPFVKAKFSGRTFLRSNYTTNMLFDDISDNFTGIGKTYSLTVGGANTSSGIGVGNGVLFINGVFQTPLTTNNSGHNYEFQADTTAGISTVEFTGITSENGQPIVSESDINQNQVPRGGLIVSMGSTPGLGYAPLVGAKASLFKNAAGAITSVVGIATTSGINYGISTAAYDNITGIITVTTDKVHGFSLGQPNTVQLKGLEFVCPKTVVGQPTNATYDGVTGISTITIANHGLVNGDAVILETGSICFTCSKDSNNTTHCYPRATDPAANQYLTVSNVTTNTFRVNVGASNPGDVYAHTFVSATATAVKTIGGGGYVGVTTTIFQDHDRPLFLVGIVSERTFEVQAGASTIPHTYQGGGVAYEFFEDNTFGSGYRGGTVAIGVTDLAYEHRFVSAGIGSIRRTTFNGAQYTATNAVYESHSGLLTLTIPNHNLTTSDTIGIDTGGLVFKCSKDDFFGNHPYPRGLSITSNPSGDPIAGVQTGIGNTTLNTVTIFVGQGGGGGTGANITATVGVGGTLAFNIVSAGTSYVNPRLIVPEPTYENVPVVGVSRLGIGATTDTGENLLLNIKVGASDTTVGIGSTLFEISEFSIARPGHSFKVGDKFKPVGLITSKHLSAPIQEFELEVIEIFRDKFSAWQFGEIDFIDSIENLQDGSDVRFPLFFNGQLLSFEKDDTDPDSTLIDLDAVLIIFVNGVLQTPKVSYQFEGGSTFTFTEAPDPEDKVDIFFYKGEDGVDVIIKDIQETIKIGDELRVTRNESLGITTSQKSDRIVKEILSADLVETDIYTGVGIDIKNEKPVRWEKQKVDIVVGGDIIHKTRGTLEPQIYPTAKIIRDLATSGGLGGQGTDIGDGIFVDDAMPFFYEKERYGKSGDDIVDALITSGDINAVSAAATATVSAAGTVSALTITDAGSGYSGTVDIGIQSPENVFVGIGSTATATATVSNGQVTSPLIVNPGLGYTYTKPPKVIISLPPFKTEKITTIENVEGYTGIITGIAATTTSGQLGVKFFYRAVKPDNNGLLTNETVTKLKPGYPILVTETSVGNGVTSVYGHNNSVVAIGTQFLDNIYVVRTFDNPSSSDGEIVCDVKNNSNLTGIGSTGFYNGVSGLTTSLGLINWGRIYGVNVERSSNPISIGVTGLTVDVGLTTFPTIQRKNYQVNSVRGVRSSGSIRAFGL